MILGTNPVVVFVFLIVGSLMLSLYRMAQSISVIILLDFNLLSLPTHLHSMYISPLLWHRLILLLTLLYFALLNFLFLRYRQLIPLPSFCCHSSLLFIRIMRSLLHYFLSPKDFCSLMIGILSFTLMERTPDLVPLRLST